MPIPEIQAGKEPKQYEDPINLLAPEITENCNKYLRRKITFDEWEIMRDLILKKYGFLKEQKKWLYLMVVK